MQDYVEKSIAKWVESSDKTQDVSRALAESKQIISMFSNAVSSGTCVAPVAPHCEHECVANSLYTVPRASARGFQSEAVGCSKVQF